MDLKRYVLRIQCLVFLLVVYLCLFLLFPMELLSATQKKTQKELELKLKIPPVTINWKSSLKIIGTKKKLVPPKYIKFSFPDLLVNPEMPEIRLPNRFFPTESSVDLELAYAGYAWYLDLFGNIVELFETGRAYLHKKSPVEAFYYFEKAKDKAKESENVLYLSASLFWGVEALMQMNQYKKASQWRDKLLKMKGNVSLPYVSSASFYLALMACQNKNYSLCLKIAEGKHWKRSIYYRHAAYLKSWALYKQKQFSLAKKSWISLSDYKGDYQLESLVNAGIVSVRTGDFKESLSLFRQAIKFLAKQKVQNYVYESIALYAKGWSELKLGKYNDALVSFALFEKKYPIHNLSNSVQVGSISAKLRLFRQGILHVSEIVKIVESSRKFLSESLETENILLELAWSLFEKKEFSKAVYYVTQVTDQSPLRKIYPIALILEGLCFYEMGEYSRSFGILKRTNDLFQYRSFQSEIKLKNISSLYFSLAAIHMKDYKLAEETLRDLVRQEKNKKYEYIYYMATVWLGEILLERRKYKSAEVLFLSIPPSSTSYLQAQMGLSSIYFSRKDWKKSAILFEKIFYSSPYGKYASESLFRAAESIFNLGDFQKAIDTFDRVEKRFDGTLVSERALYQKIKLLIQRNKLNAAESALSTFLTKYSKSTFLDEIMFHYALIPFHKLNYSVSLERLEDFIRKNPQSKFLTKAYLRVGDTHYNLSDFKKAEIVYLFIANKFQLYPEAREAAYSYAMTSARRKNFSEFLLQARRVIKRSPKELLSIALSFQIAETYFSEKKLDKAFEEYLQIFAEYPNSPFAAQALFRISMIHRMNGKIDASLSSYERILRKYPKHTMRPDVLFALGKTLYEIGRYSESKKWFDSLLSEFDNHEYVSFSRYYLGICYKKLGEKQKSIEQFSKITKHITKNNVEIRVNSMLELGSIFIEEKRFEEAKKVLLPASKMKNSSISARARFLLIRILEEKEDRKAGLGYLHLAYKYSDDEDIVCKSLLRSAGIYELRKEFSTAQKILEKIERSANLKKCNKIATKKLRDFVKNK